MVGLDSNYPIEGVLVDLTVPSARQALPFSREPTPGLVPLVIPPFLIDCFV
jgi:hypothetical protein